MSTEFNEKARWAKLAGLPKVETPKVEEESKQQLDENVVGIGAINNPFPTRKPNDYEMAFEHFLAEKYEKKEVKEEVTEEVTEEMTDAEKEKVEKEVDAVRDDLDQISKLAKDAGEDAEDIKDMVDEAELEEVGFGKGSSDGTEGFGNMLYKGMDEMYKKYGEEMVDEVLEMYHSKMKKDKGMEENSTTDAKFQKTGFAEEMKKGMEKLPKSIRDKEKTDIEKDTKKALGMTEEEIKEAMMMMSLDDLMKMKGMVDNMMMMRES